MQQRVGPFRSRPLLSWFPVLDLSAAAVTLEAVAPQPETIMTRLTRVLLPAAVAVLLLAAGAAPAQQRPFNQPNYGPGYHPPLSPYLDLLRGGDPAVNYYLGTVPEFQRRQNNEVFRSALAELDQRVSQTTVELGLSVPVTPTGHVTAFGNTGGYFGNSTEKQSASRTQAAPGKPKP